MIGSNLIGLEYQPDSAWSAGRQLQEMESFKLILKRGITGLPNSEDWNFFCPSSGGVKRR